MRKRLANLVIALLCTQLFAKNTYGETGQTRAQGASVAAAVSGAGAMYSAAMSQYHAGQKEDNNRIANQKKEAAAQKQTEIQQKIQADDLDPTLPQLIKEKQKLDEEEATARQLAEEHANKEKKFQNQMPGQYDSFLKNQKALRATLDNNESPIVYKGKRDERVPIDHDIGPKDKVCLGGNCAADPIKRDLFHYEVERPVGIVENPQTIEDISKSLRNTPDHIQRLFLDAHGSPNGSTYFPGIGSFSPESKEMGDIWGSIKSLNEDRVNRGVEPVSLTLMQCYGASCAQKAANVSQTVVTAGDTPMSIPQSKNSLSTTNPGGSITTFFPEQTTPLTQKTSELAPSTQAATLASLPTTPVQSTVTIPTSSPTVPNLHPQIATLEYASAFPSNGYTPLYNNNSLYYMSNFRDSSGTSNLMRLAGLSPQPYLNVPQSNSSQRTSSSQSSTSPKALTVEQLQQQIGLKFLGTDRGIQNSTQIVDLSQFTLTDSKQILKSSNASR